MFALLAVVLLAIVAPVAFLALFVVGSIRKRAQQPVGPRLTAAIAFLGGLSLGAFLLVGGDLVVDLPILAAGLGLAVERLRSRRPTQAGWLLVGIALPWTLLLASYSSAIYAGRGVVDPMPVGLGFVAGLIALVVGAALILSGDRMRFPGIQPSPRGASDASASKVAVSPPISAAASSRRSRERLASATRAPSRARAWAASDKNRKMGISSSRLTSSVDEVL